jgi:hypothetical protein
MGERIKPGGDLTLLDPFGARSNQGKRQTLLLFAAVCLGL